MIKNFEQFNEMITGIVNFSDLSDNWSASFHLSDEIKKLKKEYVKLGKNGSIKKIIDIVEKLDKPNYNKIKSSTQDKYNISLPEYKNAISEKYWHGKYSTISKIIIMLEVVSSGVEYEKNDILDKIEELKSKFDELNNIKN